jgi:uncharacterized membrane protein
VLIHLINRERRVVVEFPSLMFLQKIPYRSVRRQKFRHLLLLALRCVAFALLAAAFARPFFPHRAGSGAALTGARERVVLLDRSYSMGYGDHWKKAQDAARAAIRDLGSGDRATLVVFANDAEAASQPTANHAEFERAVGRTTLSSEGTRYAAAMKLGSQILAGSNLPRREAVLISDFRNAGWARREDVRLPVRVAFTAVDVSQKDERDMAVTQVTTDRDHAAARDRVTVAARVTNTAPEPRTVEATLEIGGRVADAKRVTVPAKGAAQVRFAPVAIPLAATRGSVRIPHDGLAANDIFNFTVAPDEAVSVLVVEPANARTNESLFLSRALSIGDRPAFHVTVKAVNAVTPADLSGRSLVVLNEVSPPAGPMGVKLRELVMSGAGVLVAPGNDMRIENWPAAWRELLPARFGAMVDRTGTAGGTLASVSYAHPIFELFSAPRSGDFSTAHLFRYRTITVPGDSGVLARFDDGMPALVEHPAGRGKIVLWASSLDEYWTDLPLQPVFLPFVHQVAKYAGRYSDAKGWFTAGDVLDLSRHGELTAMFGDQAAAGQAARTAGPGDLVLESPSGKRTRLNPFGTPHLSELTEAGFYELRGPNTPVGSGRPIAVNVDLAESDLSHFDPQEMAAAVAAPPTPGLGERLESAVTPEDMEGRQVTWWYLLIGVLIFMVAETLLSNRLSRGAEAGARRVEGTARGRA